MIRMRHEAEYETYALCAGKADCPREAVVQDLYCMPCANAVAAWKRHAEERRSK